MSEQDFGSDIFAGWREAAGDLWPHYTRHAFVKGLGDGSLPRACFLHYLVQDYVFLVHFSRAWALAVAKSSSLSEIKIAAATVDALVNHEMQLHVKTCAAEGLSEADLFSATEAPENMAYTRFCHGRRFFRRLYGSDGRTGTLRFGLWRYWSVSR